MQEDYYKDPHKDDEIFIEKFDVKVTHSDYNSLNYDGFTTPNLMVFLINTMR